MLSIEEAIHRAAVFAAVRESLAPAVDDPRGTTSVCMDCGNTFRRWKGRRKRRCATCAARVQILSGIQMSAQAGEAYNRAVLGQVAYWRREAESLGLIE